MGCEFCGSDPQTLNLVPVGKDGNLVSFSCTPCAIRMDVFCQTHNIPHTGFEDRESSACIPCINEVVETDGQEIEVKFREKVVNSRFESAIIEALTEYLEELPPIPLQTARIIVTRAMRTRMLVENVIDQVVLQGPHPILPWYAPLEDVVED